MSDGTRTTDLPQKSLVTHFLANTDESGVVSTSRVPVASAVAQIGGILGPQSAVTAVETRTLSTPPGSPGTGKNWIVGAAPTGAWSGKADNIATWNGTAWSFAAPADGYSALVIDEGALYFYSGANLKWTITTSDTIVLPTWAALNAITGVKVGQRAEVISDAGTHTDPVVGGTVANSGVFSWSSSPAGWQWLDAQAKANQTDLDAAELRITALEATDPVYNAVSDAVSTQQIVGTEVAPANPGSGFSNATFVFSEAVVLSGFITRLAGYGINGGGALKIKRFTKAGNDFTQVGSDYSVAIPAGAFSLDLPFAGLGAIPVVAGEYLGFYGGIAPTSNMIGFTSAASPPTGFYTSGPNTGNNSSFTDASVDNSLRIELAITVSTPTVTEARIAAGERAFALNAESLRDILDNLGIFSPAMSFLDKVGAWYDFADKKTMFQDAAGATPVTADGQLVRRIKDKSRYGYDFLVESDSDRPTYKTNVYAGRSALRFTSGNYLAGVKKGLTRNIGKIHIITVAKYDAITSAQTLIEYQIDGVGGGLRVFHGNYNNAGSRPNSLVRQADGGSVFFAAGAFFNNGTTQDGEHPLVVQETEALFSEGKLRHFVNGFNSIEGYTETGSTANTTNLDEYAIYLGARPSSVNPFAGDICEIIVIIGDLEESERVGLNNYLAEKWGNLSIYDGPRYSPAGLLPGIWLWFTDPRAIKLSGVDEKYVVGAVSSGGSVIAGSYAFSGDTPTIFHRKLFERFQFDDHVGPSFLQRADGHVLAFYTYHASGSEAYYVQRTTNTGDLSAWNARVDINAQIKIDSDYYNYSYANPILLPGESDRIYLFLRTENHDTVDPELNPTGDEYWAYTKSDDGGVTWATAKRIWGPSRPYTKVVRNGNSRIDFFFNNSHPANPTSTYHCYREGGNWYKSDGTLIGDDTALPLDFGTDPTLVYDQATLGYSWVWDVIIDQSNNRPVGCFVLFPRVTSVINYDDQRYYQSRWNGSAWVNNLICSAGPRLISGQPAYAGGVITDPEDPDIVYCARKVDGSGNVSAGGQWQLFKYVTANGGTTWTGTQLTSDTNVMHFRPFIPVGGRRLFYSKSDLYGPSYNTPWRSEIDWMTIT
jgi:hypothetical protein